MKAKFLGVFAVGAVLALVQALIESLLLAVLYRNLLLAPYRFFSIQIYDAFTKLYFALADLAPLPRLADRFLAQGMAPKLVLAPELIAIGVFVGVICAAIVVPLSVRGRSIEPGSGAIPRALAALLLFQTVVHLAVLAMGVKIPADPTVANVARNLLRDMLYDGVAIAIAVSVAATLISALLLRVGGARAALGASAAAVAVACLGAAIRPEARADTASGRAAIGRHTLEGKGMRSGGTGEREAASTTAVAKGYNVVLVSIDSLRADHLGAYGYGRATSPAIDSIARAGVLFEHCSSTTSWTLPAHMSLLTGRSLLGHGVVSDDRSLSSDVPTLAEAFSAAGYATGAVVSAPYVNSRYGFARGFDHYDDTTVHFETNEDSYKTVTAPLVQEAAAHWLESHSDSRFFLFLHYWDVHYDYSPGSPYDSMFDPGYEGSVSGEDFYFDPAINKQMDPRDLEHVIALYDGEIRLVDDHLAELEGVIAKLGLAGNTLVVVTADHGDEFFEHGQKGHHRSLYEEVLAVPLIFKVPGAVAGGARVNGEVSIIDVMPTVLGLTGVPKPAGLEGRDLTPQIIDSPTAPDRPVYAELYRKGSLNIQISAVRNRHKIIHHFNRRKMETYDLSADPGERRRLPNTGSLGAPLAGRMRGWLEHEWGIFDRRIRRRGIDRVVIDASTEETLRALGYVQ